MIIKTLYLLNLLVFLLIPFLFYRKPNRAMVWFCAHMAFACKMRKMYRLVILAVLMSFHFYHLSVFQCHYDVMVSSLICLVLVSGNCTDRIFRFLQNRQRLLVAAFTTVALLFIPHTIMIGLTCGTFIFGTVFYPSDKVRYMVSMPDTRLQLLNSRQTLINSYFDWQSNKRNTRLLNSLSRLMSRYIHSNFTWLNNLKRKK